MLCRLGLHPVVYCLMVNMCCLHPMQHWQILERFLFSACLASYTHALLLGVAEQLNEFVGALPVYGDVNEILEASMLRMKVLHIHQTMCTHRPAPTCSMQRIGPATAYNQHAWWRLAPCSQEAAETSVAWQSYMMFCIREP